MCIPRLNRSFPRPSQRVPELAELLAPETPTPRPKKRYTDGSLRRPYKAQIHSVRATKSVQFVGSYLSAHRGVDGSYPRSAQFRPLISCFLLSLSFSLESFPFFLSSRDLDALVKKAALGCVRMFTPPFLHTRLRLIFSYREGGKY